MRKTIVDGLYEDFSNILAFLEEKSEVSWANVANENFREDFGNFSLEKTSEEIHKLYIEAIRFVEWFPEALKTFAEEESSS